MYRSLMVAVPVVLLAACDELDGRAGIPPDERAIEADVTESDARLAVMQVAAATRGDVASAEIIDVTTDITVGERISATVNRWRRFWQSQAPCTTVERDGNVVTLDFGTLDDECAFRGRTYAGVDTVTIVRPSGDDPNRAVRHELDGFTNGVVVIDGTHAVFWNGDGARDAETDYTTTNLATGDAMEIHARHSFDRLDPELSVREGGFLLDGFRTWTNDRGEWSMDLDALAFMMDDGSAHDGRVLVTNPEGLELGIRYSRVDEDTTRAEVRTPNGEVFTFHITVEGEVIAD